MATYRQGPASATSNVDAVRAKLARRQYPAVYRAAILNRLKHAPFLEYGTSKMEPRAMIRKSEPIALALLASRWHRLPPLAPPEQIAALLDEVVDEALKIVAENTPRGKWEQGDGPQYEGRVHLQDAWERTEVERE